MPVPVLRLAPAILCLAPLLAASCAPTDSPQGFDCWARGVNTPQRDEDTTARFDALLAAGPDAAGMAAIAGDWHYRSPPPDPAVMEAFAQSRLTLLPDGSLAFESSFCTPAGCEEPSGGGFWAALPADGATRVLVQRERDGAGGFCDEMLYDPSRPDELAQPDAGAVWTRG